jgi:DNA-binding response OmpR family regulator
MARSILLVDDERPLLSLLAKFLERRGYRVAPCETGADALRMFSDSPSAFDLVVLDLKLPDMSGEEVLSRLLEISPSVRVLVSSGSVWTNARVPASGRARTAAILKPFPPAELVRLIESLLN